MPSSASAAVAAAGGLAARLAAFGAGFARAGELDVAERLYGEAAQLRGTIYGGPHAEEAQSLRQLAAHCREAMTSSRRWNTWTDLAPRIRAPCVRARARTLSPSQRACRRFPSRGTRPCRGSSRRRLPRRSDCPRTFSNERQLRAPGA